MDNPFTLHVARRPEHVQVAEITAETIPALLEHLASVGVEATATLPETPEDTYCVLRWTSPDPDGKPRRYVASVGFCIVRLPDGRFIRMSRDALADYYTPTAAAVDLATLPLID
ncbi:hypothetical protein ACOQFV_27245 [Nocardiopsis changdeensis]|uniref:Monooxygenase n=1 Tax=Nocardiopsis changdeensis TaxID=2831969 RepID=A0ABX8BL71_9ACTN|nr:MULTISPECIES: hypothetical protein [Nocardiopsis]QUX22965.1 hypothetical protein KGD84_00705 [Nocardiopsis changdeensis]QYX38908.1 hypothetical protein K1J57_10155 [Nocardiopsis sp. MT53]